MRLLLLLLLLLLVETSPPPRLPVCLPLQAPPQAAEAEDLSDLFLAAVTSSLKLQGYHTSSTSLGAAHFLN